MKKIFEDCMIAVIFTAICSVIAVIMGLIERHDNKQSDRRRPFGPTTILIYTTEWIRRVMKRTVGIFQDAVRRRRDHAVKFDDVVHRLSPEMMADLEKAPHYTMAELEGITAPVKEPIIITD